MFLIKLSKLSPNGCRHNARYMCHTYCGVVHAAHMCAVLWSMVLHTVLYAAQPLQSLQLQWDVLDSDYHLVYLLFYNY